MRKGDEKLNFTMSAREASCYSLGVCEATLMRLGTTNPELVIVEALERYRRVLARSLVPESPPTKSAVSENAGGAEGKQSQ